tara:strand:- start:950 stop:1195 length:246 start_codon:yes stop_codon:yes gene_type:complete
MIDIEPKGLDSPKRELPKKLDKLKEIYQKPTIKISILARIGYWIESKIVDIAVKVVMKSVPYWVWLSLVGGLVLAIVLLSL